MIILQYLQFIFLFKSKLQKYSLKLYYVNNYFLKKMKSSLKLLNIIFYKFCSYILLNLINKIYKNENIFNIINSQNILKSSC